MCKKKPGPRCTPDARKHLLNTINAVDDAALELRTAEDSLARMINEPQAAVDDADDFEIMQDVVDEARHKMERAQIEYQKARLIYNTSPGGMKDLKSVGMYSSAPITERVVYTGLGLGNTRVVEFSETPAFVSGMELIHSVQQRQWQQETLRKLETAEQKKNGSSFALCHSLRREIKNKEATIQNSYILAEQNVQKAAAAVVNERNSDTVAQLRERCRELASVTLAKTYISLQAEDLQFYEKEQARKHKKQLAHV